MAQTDTCGIIYRYVCLGLTEGMDYVEGLIASNLASRKRALARACSILGCRKADLKAHVVQYLKGFAADVKAKKITRVFYRKYNKRGQVTIFPAKVVKAGFNYDAGSDKPSFDISISLNGGVHKETFMSRIQLQQVS